MISRQINARLKSVQNETLLVYVGGQEGWGVGGRFGPEAQNLDVPIYDFFYPS